MERLRVSIPFFLWFPTYTFKFRLPEVYSQSNLNVQTTLMKVWHFVKGGSVSSIHPPLADLTFLLKDVALTATPFRKGREGDTAATCTDTAATCTDVQKIHQQLNYTNTAISTIATQLSRVATWFN